jgi:hypothetical protein
MTEISIQHADVGGHSSQPCNRFCVIETGGNCYLLFYFHEA